MIEISHKQAQHLIREGEDRRLPEEQWAVLYAHLESCPECRAYRQRIESYEHDMSRLLQARWNAARGPGDQVAGRVNGFFRRRKKVSAFLKKASLYLLGLALLAGYISYRQLTAPPPEPTPTLEFGAKPLYTSTPVPAPGSFRGLIALETRRDGNAEIYLLKGSPDGTQYTNLTQNPAQDTWPSWSPDGEWIAFLSDRTGKNEVFITHVAGSRLTQLTNAPDIVWIGPIQWSYDGKWLGITGRRGGAAAPSIFLYLVSVNGSSEPRSIAYTINASNWFRFSPSQRALAFLTSSRPGGLEVVNTDTGWIDDVTLEDNMYFHLAAGQGGAFDWSLGGGNLVYTADAQTPADQAAPNNQAGENGSQEAQIRMSPAIQIDDRQFYYTAGAEAVDTVPSPNRFRAVSWVPHSLIVASLVRADTTGSGLSAGLSTGCWVVRLRNAYNNTQSPRTLDDFCVTGGLDQKNWTPDGNWLVVIGRKPAETTSALYALRLPEMAGRENTSRENLQPGDSTHLERLEDIPSADIGLADPRSQEQSFLFEPQVRPAGQLLQLSPKAVLPPASTPAPAAPPQTLPGWVVYTIQQGADSWIMRSRPNGGEPLLLTGKRGEHTCPRISPDGKLVAFLSREPSGEPVGNEVNIVGLDGKNPVQFTFSGGTAPANLTQTGRTAPASVPPGNYDCPVWSPDGTRLAAVFRTTSQVFLAVIPVDGKTMLKYMRIERASTLAAPVWIPTDLQDPAQGSNKILLVDPRNGRYGQQLEVYLVDVLNSEDGRPAITTARLGFPGWDDIEWLTLSPDGQRLAMVLVYENLLNDQNRQGRTYAALQIVEMDTLPDIAEVNLPRYDTAANGFGGLTWLPDGKIELARIDGLIGPGKTVFERFDPLAGRSQVRLEQLARFEDLTYRAAWIKGGWVIFTAESGLWALNLEDAQANRASPFRLTAERVIDVDWK